MSSLSPRLEAVLIGAVGAATAVAVLLALAIAPMLIAVAAVLGTLVANARFSLAMRRIMHEREIVVDADMINRDSRQWLDRVAT